MKKIIGKLALVVVPLIAAIFMLWPTYWSGQLQEKKQQAMDRAEKAGNPVDSLAIMDQFQKQYGEDLKTSKENALKLGLDLRGGMYVTLEVDVLKLIEETAQKEAKDEIFSNVIEATKQDLEETDQPVLDLFLENFNDIARPEGKTLISYFDVGDYRDASEEKIVEKLQDNANQAIDQAQEVIRQRIDKYGVSEPNIQKQGARRIVLELPGVTNESEMRDLLQTTARLDFKLLRNNEHLVSAFAKIDKLLYEQYLRRQGMEPEEAKPAATDTADVSQADTAAAQADTADVAQADTAAIAGGDTAAADTADPFAGLSDEEATAKYMREHPFTRLFQTYFVPGNNQNPVPFNYAEPQFPEGRYMFQIYGDSLPKFQAILSRDDVRPLIPVDIEIAYEANPDSRMLKNQNIEVFSLYGLKQEPELTGEVITDATATFDQATNAPVVLMSMNSEGADKWARVTGANIGKQIAIVLDGRVYSAPVVQSKISQGSSQITGMADVQEARLLEIVLKAGALKAPVQILEERVVGPSLGEDSINAGINASLLAVLLVVIYMALYYNKGGVIADFAVLLNVLLLIAVLSAFSGTLTLPGIAGIILTIGMAVDANVLIFERIREELFKGRSLKSAVDEGYGKALSAIIDGNITTFITALILFIFGSGPIQGFALTLMIGIFGTLFTAIMVTRAIIEIFISRGATQFSFGQPKLIENK
ncbi:MAG: protein translocase subunit SecD [Bacteroidota bacterium]